MKKTKIWQIIRTFVFILCLSTICGGSVSAVYSLSKEKIVQSQQLKKQKAILEASGILKTGFDGPETEIKNRFNTDVKKITDYYQCNNGIKVYAVEGEGLWGELRAMVGIKPDLQTIRGIFFTYQNETPGLGGRITEQAFRAQFDGKKIPLHLTSAGEKPSTDSFDAITGATITSRGVKNMLNELGQRLEQKKNGEKTGK